MQFRLLGPLEVGAAGGLLPLAGVKQRATLAYLLLNANRVVATSTLLEALWPSDDAPSSARKVVQNAVWSLRRLLASGGDAGDGPRLVTRSPGYVLQVDPEQIDLFRFEDLVQRGRAELADGAAERAAELLGDALSLWRGPALSDLVEAGIAWPELTRVQNTRMDVLEDYFEARLACDNHPDDVVGLRKLVEIEPLRERSAAMLMLALYRSGRQADALNVYGKLRTALVDELGLDPDHTVQELHGQILAHAPHLTGPADRASPVTPAVPGPAPAGTEMSVLQVRLHRSAAGGDAPDPAGTIEEIIRSHGGHVALSADDVQLAVFGTGAGQDAATRAGQAVRAASEARRRLTGPDHPGTAVSAAVSTGIAVSAEDGHGDVPPLAEPMAQCQSLMWSTVEGEIRVCDRTRDLTRDVLGYTAVDGPPGHWLLSGTCAGPADTGHALDVLASVLERTSEVSRPHIVTVYGPSGSDIATLATDLGSRLGDGYGRSGIVHVRIPADGGPEADLGTVVSRIVPGGSRDPQECVRHLLTLARQGVLVVTVTGLRRANVEMLAFLGELTRAAAGTPMLIVTTTESGRPRER